MSHYRRIQYLRRDDLDAICRIEQRSFANFTPRDELQELLFSRSPKLLAIGAFDLEDRLIGYLMFQPQPGQRQIVGIAVEPRHRRQGVARDLTVWLQRQVSRNVRMKRIVEISHERNAASIALFSACGFEATGVERDAFPDGDGYHFEWRPAHSECGEEIEAERFGDDGELVCA